MGAPGSRAPVSGERDKGCTRLILRWLSAPRLLISCGEPSGDLYGGELLRHLRPRLPGLEVFGLGGEHVLGEQTVLLGHVRDLAVLVDYPSFNLRLARELKRRGVPVVYYISPQIWAWKGWRIREIQRNVAHMLVIFPFEQALYERAGVPVTFVGHPLVDLVRPATDRAAFLRGAGLDPSRPVVAVLPGSRPTELRYNLPALAGGIRLLAERHPEIQFLLAIAPSLDPATLQSALGPVPVTLLAGQTHAVLGAATLAVVVSGTATVEAALLGTPMIVVYRVASLTYALGRRMIRVPHAAMANLIAGREVVPELIQWDCTPARVAGESLRLLDDPNRLARMRGDLAQVAQRLGAPGASDRAAEAVLKYYLSLGEKKLDRKGGYM